MLFHDSDVQKILISSVHLPLALPDANEWINEHYLRVDSKTEYLPYLADLFLLRVSFLFTVQSSVLNRSATVIFWIPWILW